MSLRRPENEGGEYTSRRRFLVRALGAGVAATGVAATIATVDKYFFAEFSNAEKVTAMEAMERMRDKLPLEKFGLFNLPLAVDDQENLVIARAGTSPSDGWDCFDASVLLAVELEQNGFAAGVSQGPDALGIWGHHGRTFIQKELARFELDLTPPYHRSNPLFGKFPVRHTTDESPLLSDKPWIRDFNPHNINLVLRSDVPISARYFEQQTGNGVAGFMVSFSLNQGGMRNQPMKVPLKMMGMNLILDTFFWSNSPLDNRIRNGQPIVLTFDPISQAFSVFRMQPQMGFDAMGYLASNPTLHDILLKEAKALQARIEALSSKVEWVGMNGRLTKFSAPGTVTTTDSEVYNESEFIDVQREVIGQETADLLSKGD